MPIMSMSMSNVRRREDWPEMMDDLWWTTVCTEYLAADESESLPPMSPSRKR
jgi:hypothetical protein